MKRSICHFSRLLASLLTVLLSGTASPCFGAAIVQFKSTAEAGTSVVRLGDVADIRDANAGNVARLQQLVLAPSPAEGRELRLEFVAIRSRLQAQGVSLSETEFLGSSTILVTRGRTKQPAAGSAKPTVDRYRAINGQLTEAVRRYLSQRDPSLTNATVEINIAETESERLLNANGSDFEFHGAQPPWGNPQRMAIHFTNRQQAGQQQAGQQQNVQIVPFTCQITQRSYVLAVKYSIPKGQVLQSGDLVWKQIDDTDDTFSRWQDVVGRETTRAIRKDEPIRPRQIQSVPLIRSNDIVTVYSRGPGITVKRPFKARGSGSLDETVMLVSLDGRQTLVARVIGYHEAEVIGSQPAERSNSMRDANGRIQFRKPPR